MVVRWSRMVDRKDKAGGEQQDNFLSIVPIKHVDIGGFVPRHGSKATQTTEAERRAMRAYKPIQRRVTLTPDEKVRLIENVSK